MTLTNFTIGTIIKVITVTGVALLAATGILYGLHVSKQQTVVSEKKKKKRIVIVGSSNEWNEVYNELTTHCEKFKAVGLDCEWVSQCKNSKVALIQIATIQGLCVLIRIQKLADNIPDTLRKFLSQKSILKLGVAVKGDAYRLLKDYGIVVNGCVDLRFLVHRVRKTYKCPSEGLQGLAHGIVGQSIDKNPEIRCGNWEAEELNPTQVDYAAEDAFVAVLIFTQLVMDKLSADNNNLNDFDVAESKFWCMTKSLCQGIIDVGYKAVRRSPHHATAEYSADDIEEEISRRIAKPTAKPFKKPGYSLRKTNLYHNCVLVAPDGQPLCTFDNRKADWYVMKGLGEKIKDDPLTIRLNFEPSARPSSVRDDGYYLTDRQNICVVCGQSESFVRKMVLPQEYKRHFPRSFKAHKSHDTLLLCPDCHQVSSAHDAILRQQLALLCDAPLDSGKGARRVVDNDLQKVLYAARALKYHRSKMPDERVTELEDRLKEFYDIEEITSDVLDTAIEMDIKVLNSSYIPHSKKVVTYFRRRGGIANLEKLWRKHFLENMQPKFLPKLWSVDHRHPDTPEANTTEVSNQDNQSESQEDEDDESDTDMHNDDIKISSHSNMDQISNSNGNGDVTSNSLHYSDSLLSSHGKSDGTYKYNTVVMDEVANDIGFNITAYGNELKMENPTDESNNMSHDSAANSQHILDMRTENKDRNMGHADVLCFGNMDVIPSDVLGTVENPSADVEDKHPDVVLSADSATVVDCVNRDQVNSVNLVDGRQHSSKSATHLDGVALGEACLLVSLSDDAESHVMMVEREGTPPDVVGHSDSMPEHSQPNSVERLGNELVEDCHCSTSANADVLPATPELVEHIRPDVIEI